MTYTMIPKDTDSVSDRLDISKLETSHGEISLALEQANKSIAIHSEQAKERNEQIIALTSDLEKFDSVKKQYLIDLDKINYFISHMVRNPISQLLGISKLLRFQKNSVSEVKQMVGLMNISASKLDFFTKKLTNLIKKIKIKSLLN